MMADKNKMEESTGNGADSRSDEKIDFSESNELANGSSASSSNELARACDGSSDFSSNELARACKSPTSSSNSAAPPTHDAHITAESLAKVLVENDLSEIEYEENGRRIYLSRQTTAPVAMTVPQPVAPAPTPTPQPLPAPPSPPAPEEPKETNWRLHPGVVLSPMVGVAYMSPEPGAPPFVKEGSVVNSGQILLIIEAMKVLNPIKATKSGKVIAVLFQDQKPVEYNEPLVVIAEETGGA
ncbi:MAG: acetyl-CoA carboxylase biotin carboxyl carrier protein [Holosporales bacterium]|jgi:acetyl-CoA carboxylase biotin carboxyl carrier protein|nr:acetyl-CoA carboxylase biotin carboxyl carrier protein [Holosporales bacterium]